MMLFTGMDIVSQTKKIIYNSSDIIGKQMGEDSNEFAGYKLGVLNTLSVLSQLLNQQGEPVVHIYNKENIEEYDEEDLYKELMRVNYE